MSVSLRAQAGPSNRQKVDRAAEQRGRAAYQQFCINCLLQALDPATGVPLWHAGLHTGLSNGRITYELGGVQYLVAGAGDSLYAFALRRR